jgi:hypothetical protein
MDLESADVSAMLPEEPPEVNRRQTVEKDERATKPIAEGSPEVGERSSSSRKADGHYIPSVSLSPSPPVEFLLPLPSFLLHSSLEVTLQSSGALRTHSKIRGAVPQSHPIVQLTFPIDLP